MYLVLVILVVLVFLWVAASSANKQHLENDLKEEEWFKENGYETRVGPPTSSFIGGHPQFTEPTLFTTMLAHNKSIHVFKYDRLLNKALQPLLFEIPLADIEDIEILDQTTMERRITVGRMLMVGVFAFAWKKKKINTCIYLNLVWNYKGIKYETIFENTEPNAIEAFNKAKNYIVEHKP